MTSGRLQTGAAVVRSRSAEEGAMAEPKSFEGVDVLTAQPGPVPKLLFKPDRPREIDRYIDYFGSSTDDGESHEETR